MRLPSQQHRARQVNIQEAYSLHQAGRVAEAKKAYEAILAQAPSNFDAWQLLGIVHGQLGQSRDAVDCLEKAVALAPENPAAHFNLGLALQELNRPAEAIRCCERALAINPGNAGAQNTLGNMLHRQGRLEEAIARFRQAISTQPGFADAHNNLGLAVQEQGALDEAAACFTRALACEPEFAEAHGNLGMVHYKRGRLDEAVASLRRALSLRPDVAEAHCNLGAVLSEQGRLDEAALSLQRAVSLKPEFGEAHANLGAVLQKLGNHEAAIASYRTAIARKPEYAQAHLGLGNALYARGRLDAAIEAYRGAVEIERGFAQAHSNLLFLRAYQTALDPREYLDQARGWETECLPGAARQVARDKVFRRPALAGRRLNVGYVSGDFCEHAVSFFTEQLFNHHDRTRMALFAYSNGGARDAVTARLQVLADHWIPIGGMSDAAVCERMEADGIDVLIDLSGHTARNRLKVFALRAAPVQAHYLGFFASTGLTEMDYWIGDEILTPPETDAHFSERVWRLPRTWVSYEGKSDAPPSNWRPAGDGAVWLGSFNRLSKLTPATLSLWARLLHALPEGRLLLKTRELADPGNRQRVLDAFVSRGVAAGRIELQDGQATPGWRSHMAHYDRLDIALDPVSAVGGGTTTCDALWMAVPVVTLIGDRLASRMTASMLNALDRPEWVARTEAEYIDRVVGLARDVDRRKALRLAQRGQMSLSPLCNARELARSLEDAYCGMFQRWFDEDGARA